MSARLPPRDHGLTGRGAELKALLELLETHTWVSLIGGIGVGKSALLRALAKRLRSEGWRVLHSADLSENLPNLQSGERGPVIVLDDVTWNAGWLERLTARLEASPETRFVVGSRGPARHAAERQYRLEPLSGRAAAALLWSLTSGSGRGSAGGRQRLLPVAEALEGVPLLIEQFALVATRVPFADWARLVCGPTWLRRTPGTVSVIERFETALEALEPAVRGLLAAIALSESGTDIETTLALARLAQPEAAVPALLALLDSGLVRERAGRYRVWHPLRERLLQHPALALETARAWHNQVFHEALQDHGVWHLAGRPSLLVTQSTGRFQTWLRLERENLEGALKFALATGRSAETSLFALALTLEAFHVGRLSEAEAHLAQLRLNELPPPYQLIGFETQLAVQGARGDPLSVASSLERLLVGAGQVSRLELQVIVRERLARVYLRLDQLARAQGLLGELLDYAQRRGDHATEHSALLLLAEVDQRQQRPGAARARLEQVLAYAERTEQIALALVARRLLFRVALEAGQASTEQALELLAPEAVLSARALEDLAHFVTARAPALAAQLAAAAARDFEREGTQPGAHETSRLEMLRADLRARMTPAAFERAWQLGGRSAPQHLARQVRRRLERDQQGVRLTPFEHLLALGVTRGLSNRELARQTQRSEFTIRNRLVRLYAKLGCRNRAELARFMIAHRQRKSA